jgi:hypothetical protein
MMSAYIRHFNSRRKQELGFKDFHIEINISSCNSKGETVIITNTIGVKDGLPRNYSETIRNGTGSIIDFISGSNKNQKAEQDALVKKDWPIIKAAITKDHDFFAPAPGDHKLDMIVQRPTEIQHPLQEHFHTQMFELPKFPEKDIPAPTEFPEQYVTLVVKNLENPLEIPEEEVPTPAPKKKRTSKKPSKIDVLQDRIDDLAFEEYLSSEETEVQKEKDNSVRTTAKKERYIRKLTNKIKKAMKKTRKRHRKGGDGGKN